MPSFPRDGLSRQFARQMLAKRESILSFRHQLPQAQYIDGVRGATLFQ